MAQGVDSELENTNGSPIILRMTAERDTALMLRCTRML